jgi:putative SOS response-associated peptidase YedK
MPVILDRAAIGLWLDTGQSADSLAGLLVPSRDKSFIAVPVSTRVNNARNEGADLIEPVGRAVHG